MSADDEPSASFGSLLKRFRSNAGLSQEELAERARLSVESISALERGRRRAPYRDTVKMLAEALALSPADLEQLLEAARRRQRVAGPTTTLESRDDPRSTKPFAQLQIVWGPLNQLHGRQRELSDLEYLMTQTRVVTILGAGGIGKTRVALELGIRSITNFTDGGSFVDLSRLSDASDVSTAVIDALQIERSDRSALYTVRDHFAARHALLILDNCEHVVEAATMLVHTLLSSCERLSIVTTSREALRIPGERIYRLPPLEVPKETTSISVDESLHYPSVALFVCRAQELNSDFRYSPERAPIVARICARLDGLPLAVELAASRTAILTPHEILNEIEQHFRILGGGSRIALPRHRTMHEAIRWSYDRLSDAERRLFRRLAVFAGGFSIAAVREVSRSSDDPDDALDILISLVEKSIIFHDGDSVHSRYRLLEPIRSFGIEELVRLGEERFVRQAAARWCYEFVMSAHQDWSTQPSAEWIARMRAELDNLRATLSWTLFDGNDIPLGQQLVARGRRIWARLGHHEGWEWIETAIKLQGPDTSPALRAELSLARAHIAVALEEYPAALRALDAFGEQRANFDEVTIAEASSFAGYSLTKLGRDSEGESLIADAVSVFRAHGELQLLATGISDLATMRLLRGELSDGRRLLEEALMLFRILKNQRGVTCTVLNLAEAEYEAGNVAYAIQMCREALATSDASREERICSANLAAYLIRVGDFDEARERARMTILMSGSTVAHYHVAFAVQHLAALSVLRVSSEDLESDDALRAALLLGFVDERLRRDQAPRPGTESSEYARVLERLTEKLGRVRLDELLELGRDFTDARALQEALHI